MKTLTPKKKGALKKSEDEYDEDYRKKRDRNNQVIKFISICC